jgi:predicted MFS family arabinose efflux permease
MNSESPRHSPLTVAIAGAFVIAAAMGVGRFAYTPLLPGMQETLGWSVAQAGDVASSNYLGYLLGALLATLLVHRAQRLPGLFWGMFLSALTTFACAWIVSYPLWLCLRFLSGIASAFCMILGTAVVTEVFVRHSRPQLGSLYFAGLSVGIIGSVLIIEIARYMAGSVFVQWGLLGFASFVMLAWAWTILRRQTTEIDFSQNSVNIQTERVPNRRLHFLIIAYGLFGFGYVITATFIVSIARQFDNASLLEPATWIVVGLVGAPSLFIWHNISMRINVFNAMRVAYALQAVGVLLAGVASNAFSVILGGAMLGGTFMAITAMGFTAARQVAKNNQDKAIAWMTVSFGIGQLLGPALAGRMAEMTGSFAAPSALAAALLIIGIFLIKPE